MVVVIAETRSVATPAAYRNPPEQHARRYAAYRRNAVCRVRRHKRGLDLTSRSAGNAGLLQLRQPQRATVRTRPRLPESRPSVYAGNTLCGGLLACGHVQSHALRQFRARRVRCDARRHHVHGRRPAYRQQPHRFAFPSQVARRTVTPSSVVGAISADAISRLVGGICASNLGSIDVSVTARIYSAWASMLRWSFRLAEANQHPDLWSSLAGLSPGSDL